MRRFSSVFILGIALCLLDCSGGSLDYVAKSSAGHSVPAAKHAKFTARALPKVHPIETERPIDGDSIALVPAVAPLDIADESRVSALHSSIADEPRAALATSGITNESRTSVATSITVDDTRIEEASSPQANSSALAAALAPEAHAHAILLAQVEQPERTDFVPDHAKEPGSDLAPAHDSMAAANCASTQVEAAPSLPQPTCDYGISGGWDGLRDELIAHGVTLDFSILFETNRVLSGGVHRQSTAHALYDLNGSFDLDRIAEWKDAQLAFEAYVVGGHNPSHDVGDFQSFSNLSCDEVAQVSQLYYEQWFVDHTCRLKLGKLDANADFGAPGSGTESIHSASAFSPTCFAMVTYPNPATGIVAGWAPNENWSLGLGMYDGAGTSGVRTGDVGPATFFGNPQGDLFIGELGRRWKFGARDLVGGASLGAWEHTGTFNDFNGGKQQDAIGYYATLDQEFSRAADGETGGVTSGFLQYGLADEDVASIDSHIGAGFHWAGCCAKRPDDAFGLYVSQVHFSSGSGFTSNSETAYELDYLFQWRPGIAFRPDLQYIVNPGGDASIDDALVFSFRCELGF